MNRNITLGRDWLEQFDVNMYYDLGCIRIGKSYVKMEQDIHISSLAILATQTVNRSQTVNFCLSITKGNKELLNSEFHQIIPTEDSIITRQPGLLMVSSVDKTNKQGKFLIKNANNHIRLRKGSTVGNIETVKEYNIANVNDLKEQLYSLEQYIGCI